MDRAPAALALGVQCRVAMRGGHAGRPCRVVYTGWPGLGPGLLCQEQGCHSGAIPQVSGWRNSRVCGGGDVSCGEEGVKGLGSSEPGVSEDLCASTGWIRLEAAAAHPRPSQLNVAFVGVDRRRPPCPAHWLLCSWWHRFLAAGPCPPPWGWGKAWSLQQGQQCSPAQGCL